MHRRTSFFSSTKSDFRRACEIWVVVNDLFDWGIHSDGLLRGWGKTRL